ncbi:DUF169 domain-containing protein [Methanosarcina sp.]|uniref:DUF169 domain-containing protein n=1 Tax=Methanosarcina sp. TaxID=2213 RepID=UPI003C749993
MKHFKTLEASRKTLEKVPRLEAEFAGKQSLCSDAVVQPYLTGKMGITVGCSGSRTYTGIEESELTVGIPVNLLKNLIEGLRGLPEKPLQNNYDFNRLCCRIYN